ncbi:hypothetical protein [Arenimonas alkanexedens]
MNDSSGLRIRVDLRLRQEFLEACRSQDRSAAQVLRDYMRAFIANHEGNAQANLFDETTHRKDVGK